MTDRAMIVPKPKSNQVISGSPMGCVEPFLSMQPLQRNATLAIQCCYFSCRSTVGAEHCLKGFVRKADTPSLPQAAASGPA
jgi:hypothetical protein